MDATAGGASLQSLVRDDSRVFLDMSEDQYFSDESSLDYEGGLDDRGDDCFIIISPRASSIVQRDLRHVRLMIFFNSLGVESA